MTDFKERLVHIVLQQSFSSVIARIGSLLSLLIVLRTIPAEEYTMWRAALAAQQVFLAIILIAQPILLFEASIESDAGRRESGLRAIGFYQTAANILLVTILLVTLLWVFVSKENIPVMLSLLLLSTPALGLRQLAVTRAYIEKNFTKPTFWQAIETLTFLTAIALGIMLRRDPLNTLAASFALAHWATVPSALRVLKISIKNLNREGAKSLYQILSTKGLWSLSQDLSKSLFTSFRIFALQRVFSSSVTGLVLIAESLVISIASLINTSGLATVSIPGREKIQKGTFSFSARVSRTLFLGYLLLACASILPGYIYLKHIAVQNQEALPFFYVFLISAVITSSISPLGSVLFILNQHTPVVLLIVARAAFFCVALFVGWFISLPPIFIALESMIGTFFFHSLCRYLVAKKHAPDIVPFRQFILPTMKDALYLYEACEKLARSTYIKVKTFIL